MASAIEVTKRQLYSDAHNRYESESIPIEDCRFKNFTDFLDEIDVFKNPVTSRGNGKFKKEIWSLLGYSTNTYRLEREEEGTDLLDEENDESLEQKQPYHKYDIKWEYTIFNGIFTDGISIERANKNEIEQAIKETERFLEKTFTKDLINDVNEIRDLQEQLLEQNNNEDLERIDICIITDKEILEQDRDRLPNKTLIQSINLECRIYYWDIRRWDAMKRSKSKREPINIDFSFNDYNSYKVPYLSKQTGASIDYYLAIFPGDLIADLYDLYNTRLLENNVRVFLSSTMKANKGIKDTIKSDPLKFFAYNNGISATAETIEVNDGYISKIEDFQIVNGGQTTATIHFCRKKHKPPLSLNDVFVAVKITALQKDDEYSKIVGNISQAANTQSAISTSDFYTNDKKLVLLEQLSMKNPAQNEDDRNVYYFFERMKGQYNVQKSSQGTKTQQKIWENTYPNKLGLDKLDIARWSNMMNQLPFLVAEGAQRQFESYMKETYYERPELHLGTFKTIVGFGMIYRRIYKLCGTAQGKANLYPSRIIDSSTRQHVPVAASTAIYTASYLHMITEGRLDYWAIFDFEYDLCYSLLNPTKGKGQGLKRVNSKLDNILETFIDAIWKKIAIFGGAAAQEKSKKEECWNFVKKEVNITKETLEELNFYLISNKELNKRESNQSNDDDLRYFNSLNILLENNGYVLSRLYDIASASSEYFSFKSTIFNLTNKIKQHEKILTAKRVEEVYSFYDNLIDEGFEFKHENKIIFENNLNVKNIYVEVFKDQNYFLNNLYNFICRDESNFNENEKLYKTAKEIIDNYYISYGLSVKELVFLNNIIKKLNQ